MSKTPMMVTTSRTCSIIVGVLRAEVSFKSTYTVLSVIIRCTTFFYGIFKFDYKYCCKYWPMSSVHNIMVCRCERAILRYLVDQINYKQTAHTTTLDGDAFF